MKWIHTLLLAAIVVCLCLIAMNKRLVFFTKSKKKPAPQLNQIEIRIIRIHPTETYDPPLIIDTGAIWAELGGKDGQGGHKHSDKDIVTNSAMAAFEIVNHSPRFISQADFNLTFLDSWGKSVASGTISSLYDGGGRGLKPFASHQVTAGIQNFDRNRVASWKVARSSIYVQYTEGEDTKATDFIVAESGDIPTN